MKRRLFQLSVLLLLSGLSAAPVWGKIGVGIGTGKIQVEDKLRPGIIYQLPPVTILNTGDEASDYELAITYHEKQPELTPSSSWFSFSPPGFYLEPGQSQTVAVNLSLPLQVEPGNYFAYLEGRPVEKATSGNTTIGVAAAAKLYFTIVPASPVLGIYYKGMSLWKIYSPWTSRGAVLFGLIVLFILMRKFLNFRVSFKKAGRNQSGNSDKNE